MKTDDGKQHPVARPIFQITFVPSEPAVVPLLTREERTDFLALLFSDEEVARRPEDRKLAARAGLLGNHVSRQHCHNLHGSDLTERSHVAVKELERNDFTGRAASANLAKLPYQALQSRLGKSRRGRPSAHPKGSEFSRKTETIRSIVNRFSKQHPWRSLLPKRDLVLERYVGEFLFLRQAGIIEGSKYAPDSGKRLIEYWMKRVGLAPLPDEAKRNGN